jgi:glucosamine--fructose-6-phosphate aminotransferase (isomerizing)
MRAGIEAQPEYLSSGAADRLYESASQLPLVLPPRVYLVGTGDSYFAGLAVRLAFERWTGIATYALESLEFSRYEIETAPAGSLLVAVSGSGRVSRTVECALVAARHGLQTLAVTPAQQSRVAKASQMTLTLQYQDVGFGPATLLYLASLTGLFALGLRLARLAGRATDQVVAGHLGALTRAGTMAAATIEANRAAAERVAASIEPCHPLAVVGGGPNYGTALFGVAKLLETAAENAVGEELEDWAHQHYFATGPSSHTIVIAIRGASLDRAREQLRAVREIGGRATAIASHDDATTAALADAVLPVFLPDDELLSPLVTALPLESLALAYGQRLGCTMYGFDDEVREAICLRQIYESPIPQRLLRRHLGE